MVEIKAAPRFMRLAKKAMSKESLQALVDVLALDPEKGVLIPGTGGIRKLRWATGLGKGKRGGLRILYYFDGDEIVLLISLFKKADQENIGPSEKALLRKLILELFG